MYIYIYIYICVCMCVYVSNSRCSVNPFVIAWPVHDADVVLAAQTCLLPFSVISGGHGAAGYALSLNGFTLSMSSMAKVEVDMNEHQLTLQPGARFQAVYEAVSEVTDVYIPVGCYIMRCMFWGDRW
jgi:FAD/FMN-containing dehydrogenase